jgi:hypothetical protein
MDPLTADQPAIRILSKGPYCSPQLALIAIRRTERPGRRARRSQPEGEPVVSQNQRFDPNFPALIHDGEAAVRWIRANARRYHFDPLDLLEGAEHGDPRFESPENVTRVLDFLDKHLKEAIE